jgi:hypothetical protein
MDMILAMVTEKGVRTHIFLIYNFYREDKNYMVKWQIKAMY